MSSRSALCVLVLSSAASSALALSASTGVIGGGPAAFSAQYEEAQAGGDFQATVYFSQFTEQGLTATFQALGGAIDLDTAEVKRELRAFPGAVITIGNGGSPAQPPFHRNLIPVRMTDGGYTFDLGVVPHGWFTLELAGRLGAGVTGFAGTLSPTAAVPEAPTLATMSLGLMALAGMASRRRDQALITRSR